MSATTAAASTTRHSALHFDILARCATTKARAAHLRLPHHTAHTPMFMPVGTQGTMKGLTARQLVAIDAHVILANTYHMGLKPGQALLDDVGGLHAFMRWDRGMLTDSGGFQMVSLMDLSEVTENGVRFTSHHDGSAMLLTPEKSIALQNSIGADIMMQLDDVVSPFSDRARLEEAMHRSVRWLDRCIAANRNPATQNLFPIIQGGLHTDLRTTCIVEMVQRNAPGYAIGGLSGGEDKDQFWRIISYCTDRLPRDRPIYAMGIGHAVDLVVCVALGVDMFDCVYPTRTARFGRALTKHGSLPLRNAPYAADDGPIEDDCDCMTCAGDAVSGAGMVPRSQLHRMFGVKDTVACHLVSLHNLRYQMRLMRGARDAIIAGAFPPFVCKFMKDLYGEARVNGPAIDAGQGGETKEVMDDRGYPQWAVNAFSSVGIALGGEQIK